MVGLCSWIIPEFWSLEVRLTHPLVTGIPDRGAHPQEHLGVGTKLEPPVGSCPSLICTEL